MTTTNEQVFVNGKIFTARNEEEFVSAFKVTDGEISWVGDESKVDSAGAIDLESKTVLPGFIDVHTHPMSKRPMGRRTMLRLVSSWGWPELCSLTWGADIRRNTTAGLTDGRRRQRRSNEAARSRPAKDRRTISPARYASIRCSKRPIRHALLAPASHSSRAPAPHGIRIPSVRRWLSLLGAAGCSAGAAPSRKSGRVT
jgi:hypothetical protein